MSGKYFMPSLGASHSHVEDVVARYLGRKSRVTEGEHQGREGYYIHTSEAPSKVLSLRVAVLSADMMQATLEDIKSEVRHSCRNDRAPDAQKARSDINSRGHLPTSDIPHAIRGQAYNMRPPAIPEHQAVQHADDDAPLSRCTSRAESTYAGRDGRDKDSLYGPVPSHHPSPSLSTSRMTSQPIAIPAGRRRSSVTSDDPSSSFDGMYGFRSPDTQIGQSGTYFDGVE